MRDTEISTQFHCCIAGHCLLVLVRWHEQEDFAAMLATLRHVSKARPVCGIIENVMGLKIAAEGEI
eukprot:6459678-Amphidinium_carterae.2